MKLLDPNDELYRLCPSEADRDWVRTCGWSVEAKKEFLLEERQLRFADAMQSAMAREIKSLTDRVLQLEQRFRTERKLILDGVATAIAQLGYMSFCGTWDAEHAGYAKGAVVQHDSASWVAVTKAGKGARPGRAPEWRMTAKGEGR